MTPDEMLAFGEQIAAGVIRAKIESITEPELAQLAILVACQVMLMGQLFANDAGLNFAEVFDQEFRRASAWHERTLTMAAAIPKA